MSVSNNSSSGGNIRNIRVVLVGDPGTGKTSLISACLSKEFPENPPPVLPPASLPHDVFVENTQLTLVDTSSRLEDSSKLQQECRSADVIVMTYACDDQASLQHVSTVWMPLLRELQLSVPVIVVGCKQDKRVASHPSLEDSMGPIMREFREIETCLECSALKEVQVNEVFFYAQKAVLHPTSPLFDQQTNTLTPKCVRALKRIFVLCDQDRDGALSDEELNAFQVECFSAPLHASELEGVKRVVSDKMKRGLNERGLTLPGFLFLHALFIEKGRHDTTWTVLRKFGYSETLELRPELLENPEIRNRKPDQSVELTERALEFLEAKFNACDHRQEGALSAEELDELFSTSPSSTPWDEEIFRNAAETAPSGALTKNGFISMWSLLALLSPFRCIAFLVYLGMPAPVAQREALRLTKRRRETRRKGAGCDRNVIQAFVFGPKGAGKSFLLRSLVSPLHAGEERRPPPPSSVSPSLSPNECTFAAKTIRLPPSLMSSPSSSPTSSSNGITLSSSSPASSFASLFASKIGKVLVLREVQDELVPALLASPEAMAPCDVALFVYDSSDESSFQKSLSLLHLVSDQAERKGFECPSLLVAAKDDLDPFPSLIQQAAQACSSMGIPSPVPVSSHVGDNLSQLWLRIIEASLTPHLGIPDIFPFLSKGMGIKGMAYGWWRKRSPVTQTVTVALVGSAVALALIYSYRLYAARRASSS